MIEIEGFEILEKLGTGGMATVWKARQKSLDRIVAIKILSSNLAADPADVDRFQEEARAAARLKHPGIVQVYDASAVRGIYYFVMEYVAGYTVGDWLARKGVLTEADVLLVGECVADALSYAWQKAQIIHCDIKPDNVMVDSDGTVKVADLGLARTLSKMTMDRAPEDVMGTPAYMSPEQTAGDVDLDCRADIYALGATLYHALTGQMLFDGRSETDIVELQAMGTVPDPIDLNPDVSKPVCWLVEKMLAKDRAHRQQDWESVTEDIRRVKTGMLPAGRRLPDGVSTVERSKRRVHHDPVYPADMRRRRVNVPALVRLLAALVICAAIGLVFVLIYNGNFGGPRPPHPPVPPSTVPPEKQPAPVDVKNQRAREMYEFAVNWASEHPSEWSECIQRFERVVHETRGTKYSLMADSKARELEQELEQGVAKVMRELEESIQDHVDNGEYLEAARILEEYVGDLAEPTREARTARAAALRKQHEDLVQAQRQHEEQVAEKTREILDTVAETVVTSGAAEGLNALTEAVHGVEGMAETKVLTETRDLLSRACDVHQSVLDSFRAEEGRRVYVELTDGRHRFTIVQVSANRVEVRERTGGVGGAERTLSFGIQDLSSRERLSRMGSEEDPHVCLLKGLMALNSRAWESAERYFARIGSPLADALLQQVQTVQKKVANETAERDLRKELAGMGIAVDAFDENLWLQAIASRSFTPMMQERAQMIVPRFEAEHGDTDFATRAAHVLAALENGGEMPEPPVVVPVEGPGLGEDGATNGEWVAIDVEEFPALGRLLGDNPELKEQEIRMKTDADGTLLAVRIRSAHITDLTAVSSLHGIRGFECTVLGSGAHKLIGTGALSDLLLRRLALENCRFSDTDLLEDMPLEELSLRNTSVHDLSPLKQRTLRSLDISGTRVSTLKALVGLDLERLYINNLSIRDLSAMAAMPLVRVGLANTRVTDFSPLAGKEITWLDLRGSAVKDLEWVSRMPLEVLYLADARVTDISPIAGKGLVELSLANCPVVDFSPLEGMLLEDLDLSGTAFCDTSLLSGCPLKNLNLAASDVTDLSGLKGVPLKTLNITTTDVSDISVLAMPSLRELRCRGTKITDFTPLAQSGIRDLWADSEACSARVVRSLESLRTVNGRPVEHEAP